MGRGGVPRVNISFWPMVTNAGAGLCPHSRRVVMRDTDLCVSMFLCFQPTSKHTVQYHLAATQAWGRNDVSSLDNETFTDRMREVRQ